MTQQFRGGVAVITGAASGIGTGLARKAASLGMRLVLADVNAPLLHAFAATLEAEVWRSPPTSRRLARWGREKATCSRVGVTVMVAATRSPRPSVR